MTVHSTQLGARQNVGATSVTLYTCPSGKRTILKSLWCRNSNAAAQVAAATIVLTGGGSLAFFIPLAATPAAGSTVFLDLWVVLNAGDVLKYAAGGTNGDVIASGAELKL
jgi:hypothetical protein